VTQTVIEYDPTALATQADPYPAYRLLLEHAPVYRNEPRDFYALSRFADVQSAFRDWRTFSNAGGVTVDELLALTGPSFLTMDPPRHDLLRAIVREPFRPKALAALEERIRAYARELLDPLEGEVEMMTAFAERLPVRVVCELLGFSLADELVLKSWSNAILERVPDDDRTPDAARTAAGAMREYFVEQLANRRRHPGTDILSLLVTARPGGEPLPHEELVGTCFLLFEAGNSTATALLGTSILLLGPEPARRRWFARNPGGQNGAIEELLRFESPVQNMGRIATRDVEVHGVDIPAGARVLLVIGAANRDPRAFEHPDVLDLKRAPRRNLAFGDGIHHCIGAPLARLEGCVALCELLGRWPDYDVTEAERFHDVTQRNLKRLVVRFDR
jgi:cytochrome P450